MVAGVGPLTLQAVGGTLFAGQSVGGSIAIIDRRLLKKFSMACIDMLGEDDCSR